MDVECLNSSKTAAESHGNVVKNDSVQLCHIFNLQSFGT